MPPPGFSSLNIEYIFRVLYETAVHIHLSTGGIESFLTTVWLVVTIFGYLLSAAAIAMIVYTTMQIYEIRRRESIMYGPLPILATDTERENPRWQHVQDLIASTNASDWRQAIIEADIMLGEMLTTQGYHGESIGEQLKQIEPADFDTLDDAWAAHKVRNEIAHAGSAFVLSDTLATRTIAQYENVFREFELI